MREDRFLQSQDWLELRYRVLKAHNGCCQLCKRRGDERNPLQVDHIKPRSKHPELALVQSNLQVLCRECNLGKSNKDQTDWRFMPTREFMILESADPLSKAQLQQFGWLMINGPDRQIKRLAEQKYKEVWRQVEAAWYEQGCPGAHGAHSDD